MTLADLRKLTIRKKVTVRFRLKDGLECVVAPDGIARVPALKGPPDFNLEEELAHAAEFLYEPVSTGKKPELPRRINRGELEQMTSATPAVAPAHDHDDE
jgi:hypothetical protein